MPAANLLDADAPQWSFAAAGSPPPPAARERLVGLDAAVVFSARVEAARAFERFARCVVALPPWPAPGSPSAAGAAADAVSRWAPALPPSPLLPHPEDVAAVATLRSTLPSHFVALHPGSGAPRKNWPGFPALAARLPDPPLVVVGPAEEERGFDPDAYPGARFARGLSNGALGALLAAAGLVVGNDSGVLHLAAAFGAPVLGLYGPTDPETWAPWGTKVQALRAPGASLADLEVEAVLAYVCGARTSVRLISR
ncbi:MAG: hypothetical protein NDJ94_03940 [Vicinamibacteria bacterium]|nr:hypothetical protein [Vicinamibacteria bacterium]